MINFVINFEANFIIKDMEEIYGEKRPVAKETNYYETQRNKREEQFAPSYSADYPKQNYQRQTQRDNTFQGLLERNFLFPVLW